MGLVAVHNVLLNGQGGPSCDNQTSPQTGIPTATWYFPAVKARAAVDTVWKIYLQSLQGAPTTATVTFGFELGITTTSGNVTPQASPGTYTYSWTDAVPKWQAVTANDYPDWLPDGDFPPVVADQTTSLPVFLVRRIKGGVDHRLRVDPAYTGGTNPGFIMSVECEVRY